MDTWEDTEPNPSIFTLEALTDRGRLMVWLSPVPNIGQAPIIFPPWEIINKNFNCRILAICTVIIGAIFRCVGNYLNIFSRRLSITLTVYPETRAGTLKENDPILKVPNEKREGIEIT